MQGVTLTVTQLNDYVRRSLASDPILQGVSIRGEISNFKAYTSGHWYFTLKDETSRIDCAMFRQHNYSVNFLPRDGMRVLLQGSAGLYVQNGKYQFYAEGMKQDGVGDLYQRFLQLKDKLEKEGLFDASRKRPLPLLPRKVGIVTSISGAVLHDIRTVAGRRFPGIPLVLRPCQVQGEGAAEDIANGIREVCKASDVDVIIVGRGGGSLEDLWAFNEEVVARAVAFCPVPVISAVGHETDVTLCDFAADMRAPTPSAAAELAVPERDALLGTVDDMLANAGRAVQEKLLLCRNRLMRMEQRLMAREPLIHARQMRLRTEHLQERLRLACEKQMDRRKHRLENVTDRLHAAGPAQALSRGYALVLKDNRPVTHVEQAAGDMTLVLQDGRAQVRVLSAERGEPFGGQKK